jgi:hypothetical protein
LPDRSDVDGELWRGDVDLNHLTPHERDGFSNFLANTGRCGMEDWVISTQTLTVSTSFRVPSGFMHNRTEPGRLLAKQNRRKISE